MKPGQIVTVRGVPYLVTSVRRDGEPCLTRLDLHAAGGLGSLVRAPGGGMLGAQ